MVLFNYQFKFTSIISQPLRIALLKIDCFQLLNFYNKLYYTVQQLLIQKCT
jgi:hypothetical protein